MHTTLPTFPAHRELWYLDYMRIEHIALWSRDLETLRDFYVQHFGCRCGEPYHNKSKGFRSYFLDFGEGARLEIMSLDNLVDRALLPGVGYAHFALSLGSEQKVRDTTERLRHAGISIVSEPRTTGDGYFESVIADPDGNRIELTV